MPVQRNHADGNEWLWPCISGDIWLRELSFVTCLLLSREGVRDASLRNNALVAYPSVSQPLGIGILGSAVQVCLIRAISDHGALSSQPAFS